MRYLARVQRKPLFGQAELQLLSHQTGDGIWLPIRNAEPLFSSETDGFTVGMLLMVDLADDRRLLRVEEASRSLIDLLYTLSKPQPAHDLLEIERWRQSLTQQSQELSRRETEIEARQEQLQHWENLLRQRESSRQHPG